MRIRLLTVSLAAVLLAAGRLSAQDAAAPAVSFVDDVAVVLEYDSAYDVHSPPEAGSTLPLRSQLGSFDTTRILGDLESAVDPASYDFVLLYSVRELPGWIHAGDRNVVTPARNIGSDNCCYGAPPAHPHWTRLRAAPHMNSLSYAAESGLQHAHLVAAHEMSHFWNVRWNRAPVGPHEWRAGMPPGWLAGCCAHWTWNWIDDPGGDRLPGIMASDPTSERFNEFDLYAMGLMGYEEVRTVRHEVYECEPPEDAACPRGAVHAIGVDDLIDGLRASAPDRVDGDGRRFPDTDPATSSLRVLLVIVMGRDETLTDAAVDVASGLAAGLPAAWGTATRGRSEMSVAVVRPPAPGACAADVATARCVVPTGSAPGRPIELPPRPAVPPR
jgi:hypothetical protein